MPVRSNKKGFSPIETVIATSIFIIFATGIYGGIQAVFKIVYQSRVRIIETAVLNEQLEIIRNMSYFDIGILNGSPAGLLERTVTTTRNNIDLTITRTIRNIDDSFDGTIDAAPMTPPDGKVYVCHSGSTLTVGQPADQAHINHGDTQGACAGDPEAGNVDTYPADYKFVEASVICDNCGQRTPLSLSTIIGPKYLEGDATHGAMFIEVINANGQPVSGATVHLLSTSTDPTYDFYDDTDDEGMIRIVDLAPGDSAYHITVTKDGYIGDMTTSTITNPLKPPASVLTQEVTSRTFTIDEEATMNITTMSSICAPISAATFDIEGERLVSTDPELLIVEETVQTDGSGEYTYSSMPWDTYTFIPTGYDIVGTIPSIPLSMLPGATTDLSLLFGPDTDYSLLVHVQDSASQDPISSSTITVVASGYNESVLTGVGTVRQTDWSQGSGQQTYTNDAKYFTDDGNIDISTSAGDVTLALVGQSYVSAGWLESSTIDLGVVSNFVQLTWNPTAQPIETGTTSLQLQLATSNTSTPVTWDYLGPDGTNSTFYTTANQDIHATHNGDQFVRYKAYLETASTTYTPTLSDVAVSYVTSCTPPGQGYFGDISNTTYTVSVSAVGYTSYENDVDVGGDERLIVELVAQ